MAILCAQKAASILCAHRNPASVKTQGISPILQSVRVYRFIDQPGGWLGEKTKPDVPYVTNLRLDPFERTGWPDSGTKIGAQQYFDWFKYEFWRFVFVQKQVEKLAMTAIEFPPMQKGASFNLDAMKAKIEAARAATGK